MTNFTPEISATSGPFRTRGVLARFAWAALACAVVTLGVARVLAGPDGSALGIAVAGYIFGAGLAIGLMRRGYPHAGIGASNLVTLVRLALAAALLAPLAGGVGPSWAVFAAATLALSLDGVDGWLARRERRVSDFGARFDMEVDSALAFILALSAWSAGAAGGLVLLIGLPRYVFAAAGLVLPWLARPMPDRFSRKAVCVLQMSTLIALQLPIVPAGAADPVVTGVAAVLVWSFGRDTLWLWRASLWAGR